MKKLILIFLVATLYSSCIEELGYNELEDETLPLVTVTNIILSDAPGTKDVRVVYRINKEHLNSFQEPAIKKVALYKNGNFRAEWEANRGYFEDTNLPVGYQTCYELMPVTSTGVNIGRSAYFCID